LSPCPVIKGDANITTGEVTFVACLNQPINIETCQLSNTVLDSIIIPYSTGQTACVRLLTRGTPNACG